MAEFNIFWKDFKSSNHCIYACIKNNIPTRLYHYVITKTTRFTCKIHMMIYTFKISTLLSFLFFLRDSLHISVALFNHLMHIYIYSSRLFDFFSFNSFNFCYFVLLLLPHLSLLNKRHVTSVCNRHRDQ